MFILVLDEKLTGRGRRESRNGVYVGDFVEGEPKGCGKYTHSHGLIYEGEFKDSYGSVGRFTWPNGDIYEGTTGIYPHINTHLEEGILITNYGVYEGSMEERRQNPERTFTSLDGSILKSQYLNLIEKKRWKRKTYLV